MLRPYSQTKHHLYMMGSYTSLNYSVCKNAKAQGWPLKKVHAQSSQESAADSLEEQHSGEMDGKERQSVAVHR